VNLNLFKTGDRQGSTEFAMKIFELAKTEAPQQVTRLTTLMSYAAQRLWQAEAAGTGSGWGLKYAQAIKVVPIKGRVGGVGKVYADEKAVDARSGQPLGLFVNIVEDGIKSWSIRNALLASPKAKRTRDGYRIIHVPFRMRVPGKQKPSLSFSGVQTGEIYNIVRGGTVKLEGGQYGLMAGLSKFGKPGHSQYLTFRTVSDKTPDNSWNYPDTPATPVYEKVRKKVDDMIDQTISAYVAAYVEETRKKYK
jgi:hypothetical protein